MLCPSTRPADSQLLSKGAPAKSCSLAAASPDSNPGSFTVGTCSAPTANWYSRPLVSGFTRWGCLPSALPDVTAAIWSLSRGQPSPTDCSCASESWSSFPAFRTRHSERAFYILESVLLVVSEEGTLTLLLLHLIEVVLRSDSVYFTREVSLFDFPFVQFGLQDVALVIDVFSLLNLFEDLVVIGFL